MSINDIGAINSSPLVIQVIEWLKTERLSLEVQRLNDWLVLEK
ncbi:hypothetical protein ACT8ZS_16465 [Paenibacillus sp. M.A.Huq-84]